MQIKTDYDEVVSYRKEKSYRLLVGENEYEINLNKWWREDAYETECDFAIENEEEVKKNLSEDEYDELYGFINELQ